MKPAEFEYHAPTSLAEAVETLGAVADDAKLLAGGQSLVPILALRLSRFGHLIDLNRIEALRHITPGAGSVAVGAMTRQAAAGSSPVLAQQVPLVSRAIPHIGHFQIRNRGTVGGSIAHGDPASELPAVALCLGAEIEVQGLAGARRIPAEDFFVSTWETSLDEGEIVAAVHFPAKGPASGFAIEELSWRAGDFAIAGATAAVELDATGRVARAGIALMGMGPTPIRATDAESSMRGQRIDELDLRAVAIDAIAATDPTGDVHASASYRKRVAVGLVARALTSALEEAQHG